MQIPRADFSLDPEFLNQYKDKQPEWGPLGYLVYKRTYANVKEDGTMEEFWETCQRVIEGMYQIQKGHCKNLGLPWSDSKAQRSAQEAYQRMFEFKWLPPGRGLSKMGTEALFKVGAACLTNCAVIDTKDIGNSRITNAFSQPFTWLMHMAMLGVGVGYTTHGKGAVKITPSKETVPWVVGDSREGWIAYVERLLESMIGNGPRPIPDYSQVRPKGARIKGFGGVASGPDPLKTFTSRMEALTALYDSKTVDSRFIVDVANSIGEVIVSGNIRRTALLASSTIEDEEFFDLKNYEKNPDAANWPRWCSNNSVIVRVDDDLTNISARTVKNGEPGYIFLDNARNYGRMIDPPDYKDVNVVSVNPCARATATVLTPEGIRTFADIDAGSIIWSGKRWTKVINKWSTGIKPAYRFITRAGVFEGTENHRIVQNGKKIEIKDAETVDTAQGDFKNIEELDPQDVVNGLVLGDGTFHAASNRVFLCIGENDTDYFNSEIKTFIGANSGSGEYAHEISSMFHYLPRTYEREVPEKYLYGSSKEMKGFLRGLYTANGSVITCGETSGRVTLKAASLKLIEQVQLMLSAIGIRSYYTINKPSKIKFSNGTYECKQSYDLNITTDRYLFRKLIGFVQKYKNEKLDKACPEVLPKYAHGRSKSSYEIVEKEYVGDEEVFDITVDDPDHTYWTGGLLVSNCGEIPLENGATCNLCDVYPSKHDTYDDYIRTLKFAYLYTKTVTLVPFHSEITNAVTMRNRRIGCSQSGIHDAIEKHGLAEYINWLDRGYKYVQSLDEQYSNWLCIPKSIKTTTVKPAGSTSKILGVREGVHQSKGEYELQAIRIEDNSPILPRLHAANYRIEKCQYAPNTMVVYFPAHYPRKHKKDPTMWEQLEIAAMMQAYWADNAVSVTIDFDPDTEAEDIPRALQLYARRLKSVSFLPRKDHNYTQPPKQVITREEYEAYKSQLKPLDLSGIRTKEVEEKFCDGGLCEIK